MNEVDKALREIREEAIKRQGEFFPKELTNKYNFIWDASKFRYIVTLKN